MAADRASRCAGGRGAGRVSRRRRLPRRFSGGLILADAPPATAANRIGELLQHPHRGLPADAAVGDALPVLQRRQVCRERLLALDQMALQHDAENVAAARGDLCTDLGRHLRLAPIVAAAVGMAAVDHHPAGQIGRLQRGHGCFHAGGIEIRPRVAAPQDEVAIGIAGRGDHHGPAVERDGRKAVRLRRHHDGVHRRLQLAAGRILEPQRGRQRRGHLPMQRAFGGARADGAPAQQLGVVLRRNQIENFRSGWNAQTRAFHQQASSLEQTLVKVAAPVQIRVVDHALPAQTGTRLLEIHPHHQKQGIVEARGHFTQTPRVLNRRSAVVDGARPDNDQQPVVIAPHDVAHRLARAGDDLRLGLADGHFGPQFVRRGQQLFPRNVEIGNTRRHERPWMRNS